LHLAASSIGSGDYVWLNFDPQSGHEQRGQRPAIVLSPREYNAKVGLGIFCPITSHEKGYPFEVKIDSDKINGVILADQIKSLDWRKRNVEFICRAKENELQDTVDKISTLIIDV
jgi:mRNA interferase MazF